MEYIYKSKDEITLKEFQQMLRPEKEKYLQQILEIPSGERSLGQKFILKFYGNYTEPEPTPKKFLEL